MEHIYWCSEGMRNLLASFSKFSKSKRGKRCNVHSLDSHRARTINAWVDVWDFMDKICQEEIAVVNRYFFEETLDGYLRKHRFCTDCKATVIKAYGILTLAVDPATEPGYIMEMYAGIIYNPKEDQFHLPSETEFISGLISKAVPELAGG